MQGVAGQGADATVSPAAQQTFDDQAEGPSAAVRRSWSVAPRLSVKGTYSDNANLSVANAQSDWITDIAPGVTVEGRTRRLKMHLAYDVHQLLYAQRSSNDQTQQALNGFGTLEAIDKFLFLDMSGMIAQQRISAFGRQSAATYSINENSTETSTYRFSPYVKGRLGGYVDYEGRFTRTGMRTKSAAASDYDSEDWQGRFSGDTPLTMLGWSVDAERQKLDYHPGRQNNSEHERGRADLRISPEVKLSLSAGQERNDFLTAEMSTYNTHGVGFEWRPSDRTDISMFKEKRFFGDGHTVAITQRTPNSSLKYVDTRDVSVLPNQSGVVGLGTFYDMLFAQYASTIPNETIRGAFVNALLSAYGIPPDSVVTADFLSSQATVQRRQELTYVLTGVRNVLTLSLVRSRHDRVGTMVVTGFNTDFTNNSSVTQQGVNVGWAHKLSALSSMNVMASQSRSRSGNDSLSQETTQKMLSASVSTRLGNRTQGSLTVRRTLFTSSVAPYSEDAVTGMISVQF